MSISTNKLIGVVAIAAFFIFGDLLWEMTSEQHWAVLTTEVVAFICMFTSLFVIWRRQVQANILEINLNKDQIAKLQRELGRVKEGISDAIDTQFIQWSLTPAEVENALLIMKGLSIKEISSVREVAESTVKQQCTAIYRKSGLKGRQELVSYFIEDFLTKPILKNSMKSYQPLESKFRSEVGMPLAAAEKLGLPM